MKLIVFILILVFSINPALSSFSSDDILITESSYISQPYSTIGFISSVVGGITENTPRVSFAGYKNACVSGLKNQVSIKRGNGILNLRFDLREKENSGHYLLHCEGMAIKIKEN